MSMKNKILTMKLPFIISLEMDMIIFKAITIQSDLYIIYRVNDKIY